MISQLRFTSCARDDFRRLFRLIAGTDAQSARRALVAIRQALGYLADMPFAGLKYDDNAFMREFIIPLGAFALIGLYEIEAEFVTILAIRQQAEQDFF